MSGTRHHICPFLKRRRSFTCSGYTCLCYTSFSLSLSPSPSSDASPRPSVCPCILTLSSLPSQHCSRWLPESQPPLSIPRSSRNHPLTEERWRKTQPDREEAGRERRAGGERRKRSETQNERIVQKEFSFWCWIYDYNWSLTSSCE